ncbi:MAG: glycosyltransferase, partial [Actinobacteria bacterium]|nr:glycosyltransferase [Actinomycetota bacterium]
MAIFEPKEHTGMRHLSRLTDDRGIFEHALHEHPRFEHGYCTDDNARLLVVTSRAKEDTQEAQILERVAARFVLDAIREDGLCHNRMSFERMWQDIPATDDCWGRAIWGLGTAVAHSSDTEVRNRCFDAFEVAAQARSFSLRAMCFAAIGAGEVLAVDPGNLVARDLLVDMTSMFVFHPDGKGAWKWPEGRLAYSNALLPEAMMVCGSLLGYPALEARGVNLLEWLLEVETLEDHLSVTPVGGRGIGDKGPQFDQQPIEVAAIADAAMRAATLTGDDSWEQVVDMAVNW